MNRSLAGLKAKRNGQAFEELFEFMCNREHLACTRFPDGCERRGPRTLIQVQTPWDWIVTYMGRSAFLDTKFSSDRTFTHSMIKPHQVNEMLKHELAGSIAGYVIRFVCGRVFFIRASDLKSRLEVVGSIAPHSDGLILLGTESLFRVKLLWGNPNV